MPCSSRRPLSQTLKPEEHSSRRFGRRTKTIMPITFNKVRLSFDNGAAKELKKQTGNGDRTRWTPKVCPSVSHRWICAFATHRTSSTPTETSYQTDICGHSTWRLNVEAKYTAHMTVTRATQNLEVGIEAKWYASSSTSQENGTRCSKIRLPHFTVPRKVEIDFRLPRAISDYPLKLMRPIFRIPHNYNNNYSQYLSLNSHTL